MQIIVESFVQAGEPSSAQRRIRPVAGQGLDINLRVECSRDMRTAYPEGQRFKLTVQLKSREGGPNYLYSYHGDRWEPVSNEEAARFIAASSAGRR
jgi:hypothetical protein